MKPKTLPAHYGAGTWTLCGKRAGHEMLVFTMGRTAVRCLQCLRRLNALKMAEYREPVEVKHG